MPAPPPPGIRPGSPAFRVYREQAYQGMQMPLNSMRVQLREYNEMKRQAEILRARIRCAERG